MKKIIRTVEDMIELGRQCGSEAVAGSVWSLSGDLGAGKTHWTKGFAEGLTSPAGVTSPTFGLVHEYGGGRTPLFHFDFYRLESAEELLVLGWDEYLEQEGIVIAEWGERFANLLPEDAIRVRISVLPDGHRQVEW